MEKVKGDTYHITYDPAVATVVFKGMLRLRGTTEYDPLKQLLDDVADAELEMITLDLQGLEFLNSAGINILFEFVIRVREQAISQIVVRGSDSIAWQERSLRNLQKLMPTLQLDWNAN